MGNDIADGKVTPPLAVLDVPQCPEPAKPSPVLFPSYVVTRAQARKTDSDINFVSLSDSFLMPTFSGQVGLEKELESSTELCSHVPEQRSTVNAQTYRPNSLSLPVSRERLCAAQKTDPTLQKCGES